METIANLIKTNVPTEQYEKRNLRISYENASTPEIEGYLEALYLIVDDSFSLSSQTPTGEEKAKRAESWARALMGHIPESDLQRTFDHAFAEHTSSFPISAYDLKAAYDQIVEQDRAEIRKRRMEQTIADAKLYASNNYRVSSCCHDTGFRYVDDPQGSDYRGVVRCDKCNYWSRRDANRPEPRKL